MVGAELVLVGDAVEQQASDDRRLELFPVVRPREPFAEAPVVDVPPAHPEVEVPCRWLCAHCLAQPLTTGREIADLLAIDRRTVRRYIATLQELGIPVEGERGVGGGYRVRPGFRLPR